MNAAFGFTFVSLITSFTKASSKASQLLYQYTGIDPYIPSPPAQPSCRVPLLFGPSVHGIPCTWKIMFEIIIALYRESRVQAPRGLNCPVHGIPCTGAKSFQEHSKRLSRAAKSDSRAVLFGSNGLQERSTRLSSGLSRHRAPERQSQTMFPRF